MKSILAFEPYDSLSHETFRRCVCRDGSFQWNWVHLPGHGYKWRMRLGAHEMIQMADHMDMLNKVPDAIVVTSLCNTAELRGCLPPHLRTVPVILYMHENQCAYPDREMVGELQEKFDAHMPLVNLSSLLAADMVIFNSDWNRRSCLDGLEQWMAHARQSKLGHWRESIENKSHVAWPPVDLDEAQARAFRNRREFMDPEKSVLHNLIISDHCRIAWPHRWEHDKNPPGLLEAMEQLEERPGCTWSIPGPQFSRQPESFIEAHERFGHRIDHSGFISDRLAYLDELASCHWVISTARQEFFGIAVCEAMLAGCLPWLPERLSYTELLTEKARKLSPLNPPSDPSEIVRLQAEHLKPALSMNAVNRIESLVSEAIEMHSEAWQTTRSHA